MKKEISVQRRMQAESIPTRADKERYLYHLSAMTDEEKYELELKQKAAAQKAIEIRSEARNQAGQRAYRR